jgi:hypothetical protein
LLTEIAACPCGPSSDFFNSEVLPYQGLLSSPSDSSPRGRFLSNDQLISLYEIIIMGQLITLIDFFALFLSHADRLEAEPVKSVRYIAW